MINGDDIAEPSQQHIGMLVHVAQDGPCFKSFTSWHDSMRCRNMMKHVETGAKTLHYTYHSI